MIQRRWRSLTTRTLSSSSRRRVPIIRSQIAFARGAPGGLVRIRMPSAAKTASKALLNLKSRSSQHKLDGADAVGEVHQQIAGGLGGPRPGRVCTHPEQMRSAAAMLDCDQDVDPP